MTLLEMGREYFNHPIGFYKDKRFGTVKRNNENLYMELYGGFVMLAKMALNHDYNVEKASFRFEEGPVKFVNLELLESLQEYGFIKIEQRVPEIIYSFKDHYELFIMETENEY